MHTHTHFRHYCSFLIPCVIANKKKLPAEEKKMKGRFIASKLIQENIAVIATLLLQEQGERSFKNIELIKLSFLYCGKGELISIKNLELPQS